MLLYDGQGQLGLTMDADALDLTEAGYLHVNAPVARTGIQLYEGAELGRDDLDLVRVYRDEAEVFAKDALATFAAIPITIDHPGEPVTAENWKDLATGNAGEEVLREGDYLKIGLRITDAAAVAAIREGKQELSVGYTADLDWTAGETPDGQIYDARQTNIRANHIALVDRARAGARTRISPNHETHISKEDHMPLTTIMVEGVAIRAGDDGVVAIQNLQKNLAQAQTRADELAQEVDRLNQERGGPDGDAGAEPPKTEKKKKSKKKSTRSEAKAKAQSEAEGKMEGEQPADTSADKSAAKPVDEAPTKTSALNVGKAPKSKAKQESEEQIEDRVMARLAVISDAQTIAPDLETRGLKESDIRRKVVEAKGFTTDGQSDAHVGGIFAALLADAALAAAPAPTLDPVGRANPRPSPLADAYERRDAALTNAWKGE